MKLGDPLPRLDGATHWLNGGDAAVTQVVADFRAPLLVHFWSTACPLCHEGVQSIASWRAPAHGRLAVLAVYQIKDEETVDLARVTTEAARMGIEYPCAIDEAGTLAERFDSEFAPGYYLFDRDRVLRHRQMGSAGLDRVGALIERLSVKASLS